MSKSNIEWTDATWNPVTGCSEISEGCRFCYAKGMAKRLKAMGQHKYRNEFKVTCHPECLDEPLKWKKPRRIFVCSMGDLFHEDVPDEFLDQVFGTILACAVFGNRNHVFQILTKRPKRMARYFSASPKDLLKRWARASAGQPDDENTTMEEYVRSLATNLNSDLYGDSAWDEPQNIFPLKNLWLGVTAENQEQADKRIPILLQIPAAVRFVSVEPMLGSVDLTNLTVDATKYRSDCIDALHCDVGIEDDTAFNGATLNWVICGCESGKGHRETELHWVRDLRDQCKAAGVPFFLKQLWISGKLVKMPKIGDYGVGFIHDALPEVSG